VKQLPTRAFKGYGGAQQLMVPEFDLPVPTATFATCGAGLNRGFEWLDLTARVRGLPSLLAFCDHRPVPGGLDKWLKMLDKRTPEQVSEALVMAMDKTHGPWTDWFPVDQGLTTVDGLLEVLEREGWKAATCALNRECPGLLKGRYEPASAGDVVADLRALAACLRIGGNAGAKFRLTRTTPFFVRSPV
jgi:hypothetical protein